eukprot:11566367-Alexandrium_andersonii.AAC.1
MCGELWASSVPQVTLRRTCRSGVQWQRRAARKAETRDAQSAPPQRLPCPRSLLQPIACWTQRA